MSDLGDRPGSGRLAGKTAIVVGAGQTEGETMGNGRATALLSAVRERSCCSPLARGPRRGAGLARPAGHQGSAWDVAFAALYLASDEAQFVSGIVLPVDGGQGALVG
jgi:Enoyl-(Acyl carrier protein) reductase